MSKVRLSKQLKESFEKLPMPASTAMKQAVVSAVIRPDLLVRAFEHRFTRERLENDTYLVFRSDTKIDAHLEKLAEMTELPVEQVIRLAMEAYINKL